MKIVHVINSLGYGGAERQLSIVTAAIGRRGIEQVVIPIVSVSSGLVMAPNVEVAQQRSGLSGVLGAIVQLVRATHVEGPPIVVAWMYHSWLTALLARPFCRKGSRLFFYCRHGDVASLSRMTRWIATACLQVARWRQIPVVFNSRDAESRHVNLVNGLQRHVIPNAAPLGRVGEKNAARRTMAFGFLGRNHWDKGADLLPGIVRDVLVAAPEWKFFIAGPGMSSLESSIGELLDSAGCDASRVTVQDAIDDTADFYSRLDILVVPSRSESFPNVVVEAMAAGVLVAAAPAGDIATILDGRLPMAQSVAGVAQVAIQLSQMPTSVRVVLGADLSLVASERYDVERVVDEHLTLWQNH